MKRICLFVSIFTLSLSTIAIAADGVILGAVDMIKVAQESEAGKKAMGTLKVIADKYQDKLKTRQKELEKLQVAMTEKGKGLSATKRSAREKELQQKFQEYQQYAKNAQQEFATKETELSKPIREDLEKLVKEYGRTNGYTAIVHKEGLIYFDSKIEVKELTDDILKLFNAAGKK
jgi:outer membrane protein